MRYAKSAIQQMDIRPTSEWRKYMSMHKFRWTPIVMTYATVCGADVTAYDSGTTKHLTHCNGMSANFKINKKQSKEEKTSWLHTKAKTNANPWFWSLLFWEIIFATLFLKFFLFEIHTDEHKPGHAKMPKEWPARCGVHVRGKQSVPCNLLRSWCNFVLRALDLNL